MSDRNYEMKAVCTICNTPFDAKEEGYDGELNKIPAKLCAKCYDGLEGVVESSLPHVNIECPNCKHDIGLRVETLDDT